MEIKKKPRNSIITLNRSSGNPLDEILNLAYTPYVKFVHHIIDNGAKDKFYFVVLFLAKEKAKVNSTGIELKDGKIKINIDVTPKGKGKDSISQLVFNADEVPEIRNTLEKKISIDYEVNITFSEYLNDKNETIIAGSNPTGGTTEPADPYPPAKKKIEL